MVADRERGSALLIVLWASILLAALLAVSLGSLRVDLRASEARRATFQSYVAAESARNILQHQLARSADARRADLPRSVTANGRIVTISVEDERLKLDLYRADQGAIRDWLARDGLDPQTSDMIAARIADWRDVDDLARIGGAERRDYVRARLEPPANRAFLSADELHRVLGFEEAGLPIDRFVVSGAGATRLKGDGDFPINDGARVEARFTVNDPGTSVNSFVWRAEIVAGGGLASGLAPH